MKSLVNFRDLGGRRTEDGRKVREGLLLRSAEPVGLSEEDKETLIGRYHLRHIVDLRSEEEVRRTPDDEIPGAKYSNVLLHGRRKGQEQAKSPEEKEFRRMTDPRQVVDFMKKVYLHFLTDPDALRGFGRFLRIVRGHRDGSLLFHCYAGKDRTGMAAALIYTVLGVPRAEIMADYLLTNQLRRERNDAILSAAKQAGASEAKLAVLDISYQVRAEYMDGVFQYAGQASGSLLRYIRAYMGLSEEDIAAMKEYFLEG